MLRTNANAYSRYYLSHFNVSRSDLMRRIEIMFTQRLDIIQETWCISKLGTDIDKIHRMNSRYSVIPRSEFLICD